MHVRWLGSGDLKPLVLLHASPLSGRQFDRIAPLLAAKRRVITPDRIGFGHSDRLVRRLEIADYGAATLDALAQLGIVDFDVVGMHTGSCEALELGLAEADRVGRSAWSASRTSPAPSAPPSKTARNHRRYRPAASTSPGTGSPGSTSRGGATCSSRTSGGQHLSAEHACWTFHAAFDYPTVKRASELSQPLLMIWARDEIYEFTKRALPLLPPSTEVAALTHLDSDALFTDAPEELARVIESFLAVSSA